MPEVVSTLLWVALLVAISALVSASETAATAVGRSKLLLMAEKSSSERMRGILRWLMDDLDEALVVLLVTNNLVNIVASSMAAALASRLFPRWGLAISVGVMSALIIVLGEILPKSISIRHPESIVRFTVPLVAMLRRLLAPVLLLIRGVIRLLGLLFGLELEGLRAFVTREDIEMAVKMGEETGAIEASERRMIHGIISLEERRAYEVMVPRTEMVALPVSSSLEEAIRLFAETGFSRVPLYDGSLDNVVGMLYAKDVLKAVGTGLEMPKGVKLEGLAREALFVPDTARVADIFSQMKEKRVHIAIVVDEYGGTAGLLTLEDIIEEIVGDIQDEYDSREMPAIVEEAPGVFLVKASVPIGDLEERLGLSIPHEEADTVGGFVVERLGVLPKVGQCVEEEDFTVEVVEAVRHRIKRVRFTLRRPEEQGHEGD